MTQKANSFASFWPVYLLAHRSPVCRALHHVGMTGAVASVVAAVALGQPAWLAAGIVFAYGLSWIGHFFAERNRPATFGHPLWSLAGDVRMYVLFLTGRLSATLARAEEASSVSCDAH